jgi:hypothetical protein
LKLGEVLSPLLFNCALDYAIRRVYVNQDNLKLNITRQILVYADDVSISGRSVYTVEKNTETLVVASKENGLEVNSNKMKCTVMSGDQDVGRIYNIKIDNISFEKAYEFKYLGIILTNQNSIQEEIKSKLKLGNAYYHSVQNLSSNFLSKKYEF